MPTDTLLKNEGRDLVIDSAVPGLLLEDVTELADPGLLLLWNVSPLLLFVPTPTLLQRLNKNSLSLPPAMDEEPTMFSSN